MYNLIVSTGLTHRDRGSLDSSRVLEYTSESIKNKFKLPFGDDSVDVDAIKHLPTLIMEEGFTDEPVGVGELIQVRESQGNYEFRFVLDSNIPPLTNADIYELKAELDIHDFEFSRNHWAIKDVNLYRVLAGKLVGSRPQPTVFNLSDRPVVKSRVSIMMPFGGFDAVHQAIKCAVEGELYELKRADDFWQHDHIMQDIIELICTSEVVICDLTNRNPNVFYEAGIAHTLGKKVILITQNRDDVPFDLRAVRYIHYLHNDEGRRKLAEEVVERLKNIAPVS